MKLIIILLLNFFIFNSFSYSKDITGFPTVLDADTIRIGKLRIRLEGIDASELKQVCVKNNQRYFCGKLSKVKLQEKIVLSEKRRIQTLIEYRQTLIFSFITGKVRITEDMI